MGVVGGLLILGVLIIVAAYVAQPLIISHDRESYSPDRGRAASALRERATRLAERNTIYQQIRDLDFEHRTGKVSDEDHAVQRYRLVAQGVETLQQLDSLPILDQSPDSDPLEAIIMTLRKSGEVGAVHTAMGICRECGSPLAINDRFCGKCGAEVIPGATQEVIRCPSCGEKVEPGDRFCGSCGAALSAQK